MLGCYLTNTLREFLQGVRDRLRAASFFFERITLLYEAYIYGGARRGLERAKQFYILMKRVLRS